MDFICSCCGEDTSKRGSGFILCYYNNEKEQEWIWCRNKIELQRWLWNIYIKDAKKYISAFRCTKDGLIRLSDEHASFLLEKKLDYEKNLKEFKERYITPLV